MPLLSSFSPVTYASTKLSYPIFDAEFDPYNRGYLVVAGGGAESRSGVPNKITLLDVSGRDSVKVVTELDLSTEEDSPQSLASLATKQGLITLVGISSSIADQKAGKNEHLRSFDVEFPPKKRARTLDASVPEEKAARIAPFGRASLFSSPTAKHPQTYQRVLRLSPVKSREVASKRIGAISSADAATNEIVLFDATTFAPTSASILQKLSLKLEAEDLDLLDLSEGQFCLAFCTNSELSLYSLKCNFATKTNQPTTTEPVVVHDNGGRSKMRCLRWLTDHHVIVLKNRQSGPAELVIFDVDQESKASKIVQSKTLPKSMGAGARLAVCLLDADAASGERQIIIAVAGQSKVIHVLTLNHRPSSTEKQLTTLSNFTVLDTSDQHPQPIYKLAFSNFFPPQQPVHSNMSVASETQYINLASVSSGYTVAVETFALSSTPTHPSSTSTDPAAEKENANRPSVRWVLSSRHSEFLRSWFGLYVVGFAILCLAFLLQRATSASPSTTAESAGPVSALSDKFSDMTSSLAMPVNVESPASNIVSVASSLTSTASVAATSAISATGHKLLDLFNLHKEHFDGDNPTKAILVSAPGASDAVGELSARLQHDLGEARRQGAKRFEELSESEKAIWLRRLSETGQWAGGIPKNILMSFLFSQYAEVIGGGIRDAILN